MQRSVIIFPLQFGWQEFIETSDVHAIWGDVYLLVYAIDDRTSFKEAIALCQHVANIRHTDLPLFMLIGNKKDKENDREAQVTAREGYDLAKEMNCSFHELSTKANSEDVEKIFTEAIRKVIRRKLDHRALNEVKQTSHKRIMEIIEKNTCRNRAMSSVKETIDEYCATHSQDLSQDLSRDRSNTYT